MPDPDVPDPTCRSPTCRTPTYRTRRADVPDPEVPDPPAPEPCVPVDPWEPARSATWDGRGDDCPRGTQLRRAMWAAEREGPPPWLPPAPSHKRYRVRRSVIHGERLLDQLLRAPDPAHHRNGADADVDQGVDHHLGRIVLQRLQHGRASRGRVARPARPFVGELQPLLRRSAATRTSAPSLLRRTRRRHDAEPAR